MEKEEAIALAAALLEARGRIHTGVVGARMVPPELQERYGRRWVVYFGIPDSEGISPANFIVWVNMDTGEAGMVLGMLTASPVARSPVGRQSA